ncbi:decaprenyl-phosphate phosphoribosyltransferase [Candidatus Woesearchaeota archaeon]|nr:decaprenyl-phosphate phosphoribosyltransferase [Candidatus Woesearchaeota archaeon]
MLNSIIKLIRPHQYIKNIFIFMPIFFIGHITNIELILITTTAFVAFSISASAVYIFNDYQDIDDDRKHPEKKHRPLASGSITKKFAITLIGVFFIIGISIMATISFQVVGILCIYITLNIAYSLYLKHIAILDVSIIAICFVLRLFIGSSATGTALSMWIIITTFLLALFIALAKRRDDILFFLNTGKKMRRAIDGYNLQLIDGAMMIMASVVIVTYILYTTSIEVLQRMQSEYLYLTALFVVLGIMRYLQISFVENNSGSPTKIVLRDKFMQITILAWTFSFAWIVYL